MPEEELPDVLICPECGKDISDADPWAHALDHWPERLPVDPTTEQARQRQALLRKWAKLKGLI